jgi:hypothetical protein
MIHLLAPFLALGFGGCAATNPLIVRQPKFSVTEPVQPRIYAAGGWGLAKNEPVADSLTPTLEWKPVPGENVKYDLVVYSAFRQGRERFTRGVEVYYRSELNTTRHTLETPLKSRHYYSWSVRTNNGGKTSPWATYDLETDNLMLNDNWWTFVAP